MTMELWRQRAAIVGDSMAWVVMVAGSTADYDY
jgi:hypothetical protein